MKFQLINLGNRVIKLASRPVFIDYHSILAKFPNALPIISINLETSPYFRKIKHLISF